MKHVSRKALSIGLVVVLSMFCLASALMAAEVSQGVCKSFNKATNTITLEEYNTTFTKKDPYGEPTGVVTDFNVANALIGIPPEPGDVLRIAYDVKGTDRVALKVMNVSKQDLSKK